MTPHIEAEKGSIAKTVIMPGDPLRAKFIAENYLTDYKLVNSVREMFAYTGKYKGKEITVMASGMGMPSICIYSYELFTEYDVDNIIRVGTAGAYTDELNLFDLVLARDAYSESSFETTQSGIDEDVLASNEELNQVILNTAKDLNKKVVYGRIHSSDVFYKENNNFKELYDKYHCLAVEMESFALFHIANRCHKKAACLLTISDSLVTHAETTSEQRQNSLYEMIELALESAIRL